MKKTMMVLIILMMGIGVVSAQEMKPIRVEMGLSSMKPAISAEYVFPISPVSLGVDGGVVFFPPNMIPNGLVTGLRLYPFNIVGNGLYASFGYIFEPMMNPFMEWSNDYHLLSICAGYRITFLKIVTARIDLGYQITFTENENDNNTRALVAGLMLGVAF